MYLAQCNLILNQFFASSQRFHEFVSKMDSRRHFFGHGDDGWFSIHKHVQASGKICSASVEVNTKECDEVSYEVSVEVNTKASATVSVEVNTKANAEVSVEVNTTEPQKVVKSVLKSYQVAVAAL